MQDKLLEMFSGFIFYQMIRKFQLHICHLRAPNKYCKLSGLTKVVKSTNLNIIWLYLLKT